jgi:hypothetical protein
MNKSSYVFTVSVKTQYRGEVLSKPTYYSAQVMAESLTKFGLTMSEVRLLLAKRRLKSGRWYLSLSIKQGKNPLSDYLMSMAQSLYLGSL